MDKGVFRNLPPSVSGKHVDTIPRVCSSIITRLLLAFLLSQAITAMPVSSQAASLPGLSAARDGTLLRNGVPYRGVGVNYTDAFLRPLRHPGDESYRDDFRKLAANHIPFARITACGFSPSDYQLYQQDKENYFKLLDGVVQAAEESNVGLIADLFWSNTAVPDLVGEPRDQWGNSESKTRQFMRTYIREVVSRYVNSPAIWGWEFGNEYNLSLDSPDAWRNLPPVNPRLGRTRSRGPDDALTTEIFTSALSDFARTVREIDGHRMLLTGNSVPRFSAYHMQTERRNGADNAEQFATMLLRQNPGPFNPICIHTAPMSPMPHFAKRPVSYNELIQTCAGAARSASKSLYIEEFITCPAKTECSIATRQENVSKVLAAIQAHNVPLASVWVYGRKMIHDPNSLSFDDDTAPVLQMIGDFNRKWSLR
jgi:Cellulase (glycosyl hydrolase family 5)